MSTLDAVALETQFVDDLGLGPDTPLLTIAHYPSLGEVTGGPGAVADALLAVSSTLVMPAFTYQTQVIPGVGPENNAIEYGTGDYQNSRADIFRPDLPVHPDMGSIAEALRRKGGTLRSTHPILSFIANGSKAKHALAAQTRANPFSPVAWLEAHDAKLLMLGHDHRHNIALHLAEQRAGRKTFIRWALTVDDIEELPNIPGCREGFNAVWGDVLGMAEVTQVGMARAEVYPLKPLLNFIEGLLRRDPNFMLCDKPSCATCPPRKVYRR